ncbi:hypothetical protein N7468_005301 [Penicillium chermesinum]|uniref:Uncharacterized protein n=1 Tax=Penicillium chermesinum TaxID=63820 RepID=A0A9W9TMV6_9EURO|nr:uncharacterized protein N7468_005301 [Penicillium chermesinum]KAJ5232345.1 hypothetical protein N7468_005301 [Penicillium chermesinum]
MATVDPSSTVHRVSAVHADNYMQQYDARGHPVNPDSKALGRGLRRAKNDILSTMGIVVSGEDRNVNSSSEQQKICQIAAENDCGLIITTLDQFFVFFSTWWSSSLTGRILAYKHYTHAPLLDVIRAERDASGLLSFYCAGIPAWAASSALAIARDNSLKRVFVTAREYALEFTGKGNFSLFLRSLFGVLYSAARGSVLILSVEAYMWSMLQTLSLVPPNAFPSVSSLIPFGERSLFRLPALPSDFSPLSVVGFILQTLASPGMLTVIYAFFLRPELEERIYRLVRRQLPKPTLADELSIRVAFEENLIEWVVPTLGRRAEEETRRAKLTLLEDIGQELLLLRDWVFSGFGLFSTKRQNRAEMQRYNQEGIDNLRNSIESLQQELDDAQRHNSRLETESLQRELNDVRRQNALLARELDELEGPRSVRQEPDEAQRESRAAPSGLNEVEASPPESALPPASSAAEPRNLRSPELEVGTDVGQVLTNRSRSSQSPGEMSSDSFSGVATNGRRSAPSNASRSQSQPSNAQQPPRPAPQSNIPRVLQDPPGLRPPSVASERRSIAEFLEALILSRAQNQGTQQPPAADQDDLSSITAGASYTTGQESQPAEDNQQNTAQEAPTSVVASQPILYEEPQLLGPPPNILPDGFEEPTDDEPDARLPPYEETGPVEPQDDSGEPSPYPKGPGQPTTAHRVTLLSAHPVDSLASHVAAIVTTIILSPLESLYVRSLAHAFLAMNSSPQLQIGDLYPVGLWLGGRSWKDVSAYCGRIILMRGMQAALRAGVWGFLVGSTMRIGRKFYGWGSL